jgi:hypothetical protein
MALFGDLVSNIKGLFWEQINLNGYVFDAYLRMETHESLTITRNPVENGSVVTDHAYTNPKVFTFDIGMTDTAQGKVFGQFGFLDRSVSAYKKLSEWLENRTPITLNGKYGFYKNILVSDIRANDDYKTQYGMRVSVVLEQVNITSTSLVKISSASFFTQRTNRGLQNGSIPDDNVSALVTAGGLF